MTIKKFLLTLTASLAITLLFAQEYNLSFNVSKTEICDDEQVTLTNTTPDKEGLLNKYEFFWKLPNNDEGVQNERFGTSFNRGNYGNGIVTLQLRDKNNPDSVITSIEQDLGITFYVKPDISITSDVERNGTVSVCSGTTFELQAIPSDTATKLTQCIWKVGFTDKRSDNPITYNSDDLGETENAEIVLDYTDEFGCTYTHPKSNYIRVHDEDAFEPKIDLKINDGEWIGSYTKICIESYKYSVRSLDLESDRVASYTWTLPDGTEDSTSIKIFGDSKEFGVETFRLNIVDNNGCTNSTSATIIGNEFKSTLDFYAKDTAGKTIDLATGNCAMEYTFISRKTYDSIAWDLDGDGIFTADNKRMVGGPITVSMYAQNDEEGCQGTVTKELEVEPIADISVTLDKYFTCNPSNAFNFAVTSNLDSIASYFYVHSDSSEFFGDIQSINVRKGVDTIDIRFETPNGCGVSDTSFIVEVATPKIGWHISQRQSHCIPHTVTLNDKSHYKPILEANQNDSIVAYDIDWHYNNRMDPYVSQLPPLPTKHVYDTAGVYQVRYTITTGSGCTAHKDTIVKVGDSCKIHFGLIDTLVCGTTDAVEYIDSSENKDLADYVSVYARSTTNPSRGAGAKVLEGNPVYDQSTFIRGFDTVGTFDLLVTVKYNQCEVSGFYKDRIQVNGPIVNARYIKDSSYRWNDVDLALSSAFDADDTVQWEILEGTPISVGDKKVISYASIESFSLHKDDTTRYTVEKPGYYAAVAKSTNSTTGCSFLDTTDFKLYKMGITYSPAREAMCLEDSAFRFKKYDLAVTDGIDQVQSLSFKAISPSGDTTGPMSLSITAGAVEMDTLWIKENGQYTFEFTATDPYNVSTTVEHPFKVYKVTANAMTDDTTGCLPVGVEYVNTSTADTAFARFYWETNSEETPNGTTDELGEKFSTVYSSKEPISLMLIAHTVEINDFDESCVDTVIIGGAVKPIIPPVDFSLTERVCVQTPVSIERTMNNRADSVFWKFEDNEWSYDMTPSFTRKYDTAGDFTAAMRVGIDSLGYFCYNEVEKTFNVRKYYAQLNLKSPVSQCYHKGEWDFKNDASWGDEVNFLWQVDSASDTDALRKADSANFAFKTSPGLHTIFLELKPIEDYSGCGNLRDSVAIEAYGANLEFEIVDMEGMPLDTVCVATDFRVRIKDTTNIYLSGFSWTLGDGSSDSTQTDLVYQYSEVPTTAEHTIKVFRTDDKCFGSEISEDGTVLRTIEKAPQRTIHLYELEARFLINGEEDNWESCPPFDVELTNESIGYTSVLWDFGDGTSSTEAHPPKRVLNTPDQEYLVSLYVKDEQCEHSLTRGIYIYPIPEASFVAKPDKAIACEGTDVPIIGTADSNYQYQWNPSEYLTSASSLSPTFANPDSSRTFYVTVTNHKDCKIYDSVSIAVQNRPVYTGAPHDTVQYYKDGEFINFRPTDTLIVLEKYLLNNDTIEDITYQWTPSDYLSCDTCANPSIAITDEVEHVDYEVRMTDPYGCFEVVEPISFSVIKNTMFDIPKAFSPNGDGENDKLFVRGWAIRDLLELRVYNRWGQLVFETSELDDGWDGTFNGKPQPIDTYAYILKVVTFEGITETKQGDFNLLR